MTHKITSFSFNFKPNKLILLLDIDSKELDLQIKIKEAEEFGVLIKPEYHFTILGDNTGKEILDSEEEEDKNTLVKKFQDLYNSIHWEISLLDEFYKLKKEKIHPDPFNPNNTIIEKRKSIIQMAEIKGLDEFYNKLNSTFKTNFPVPVPHVTLYTSSTLKEKMFRGIGIYSEKEFLDLKPERI